MLQALHIPVETTVYLASGDGLLAGALVVGLGTVTVEEFPFFDSPSSSVGNIKCTDAKAIYNTGFENEINIRVADSKTVIVSLMRPLCWRM